MSTVDSGAHLEITNAVVSFPASKIVEISEEINRQIKYVTGHQTFQGTYEPSLPDPTICAVVTDRQPCWLGLRKDV